MGLDINAARFLLAEKSRGINFGKTLTLGRQGIYMSGKEYANFLDILKVPGTDLVYADDFYRGIGAHPMLSMDASNYENAAIIHDMNDPLDTKFHSTFDTVIDGGTLEHVFNFPNAIRNCMDLIKSGGQLVLMTPWHNFSGHGFYQFSPELVYATLSEANGFCVERMLIVAGGNWYSVKNPSDIKQRVEIHAKESILLYVTARKLSTRPVFAEWPQQSDYSTAWQSNSDLAVQPVQKSSLLGSIADRVPQLGNLRCFWRRQKHLRGISPARNVAFVRIGPSHQIPMVDKPHV
ncbi:MAG: hypothetical protein H7Y36_00675 [Armatimonadetes bacterium]|nr:hypothetical protein [Akkermansiaceae bacterium]